MGKNFNKNHHFCSRLLVRSIKQFTKCKSDNRYLWPDKNCVSFLSMINRYCNNFWFSTSLFSIFCLWLSKIWSVLIWVLAWQRQLFRQRSHHLNAIKRSRFLFQCKSWYPEKIKEYIFLYGGKWSTVMESKWGQTFHSAGQLFTFRDRNEEGMMSNRAKRG